MTKPGARAGSEMPDSAATENSVFYDGLIPHPNQLIKIRSPYAGVARRNEEFNFILQSHVMNRTQSETCKDSIAYLLQRSRKPPVFLVSAPIGCSPPLRLLAETARTVLNGVANRMGISPTSIVVPVCVEHRGTHLKSGVEEALYIRLCGGWLDALLLVHTSILLLRLSFLVAKHNHYGATKITRLEQVPRSGRRYLYSKQDDDLMVLTALLEDHRLRKLFTKDYHEIVELAGGFGTACLVLDYAKRAEKYAALRPYAGYGEYDEDNYD